jgi:hypothetical protein
MSFQEENHCLQAAPGPAFLLFLARGPGVPKPEP